MTPKKHRQPRGVNATTATPAEGFAPLLGALRQLIADSRQQVLRAVDVVQVQTCWLIGRHIVEFEQGGAQRAAYGQRLLPQLGRRCRQSLGGGSMPAICATCWGFTKPFRFATHCVAN